jgi:hypothetical protein
MEADIQFKQRKWGEGVVWIGMANLAVIQWISIGKCCMLLMGVLMYKQTVIN